ncbi:MAG: potassium transporter Kup [Cytophagales bacterium]|nr:MAG: potassium transporter Kup [Cytophagales bacterium]
MENKNGISSKITAASLLVAMGIIYGDIGTSPLYVFKAIIGDRTITEQLVYGGVSCVFWTLVFQTTFKYIWLTLRADNHGEGGIFSLYALVKRYGKNLVFPTILGATTLLADGIITPPISVASAVEGLSLVAAFKDIIVPGNTLTIGIVVCILSLLFFFQRFGTQAIGKFFGPIMMVWFSMLLILGLNQIASHANILQALNPMYAYDLLLNYPSGFWLLGAVFLCTTGAEALYSDLGHCGIKNIRISWIFVKFSLIIAYLGQAAWLMNQGSDMLAGRNPFFEIVPPWFLIPSIIVATFATIIASQALISGSYTLISEAINLNFWPRVAVRQPTESKGQIYIPSVNAILWFGCVLMMVYFKESSHMEAAYGFSITITMMMTTLLLSYFLIYRLKWNKIYVIGFLMIFSIIEISFFIANVAKIKERWMFLFFELAIFMVMYVWYKARFINKKFIKYVDLGQYTQLFSELTQDETVPQFSTHLIYLTKSKVRHEIDEKIMQSIFAKKPKKAAVYWFLNINQMEDPYTLNYEVSELIDDKVIKITINMGFKITPRTELYFKKIVQDLVERKELNLHNKPDGSTKYNSEPDFKFVIIQKFLSVENEFVVKDGLLLEAYFFLKKLGLSDEQAFGLDKSDVVIEQVPLIYQAVTNLKIARND